MIETPHAEDATRRVPIYSLYSETREPTDAMLDGPRRAGRRPAGRRHAGLHVRLHDGELPEGRGPQGPPGHRLRPAQPDRRPDGRRPDARAGLRVVRRALPDPAAARDDHRRARAPVQRCSSASARSSRPSRWRGGRAADWCDDDRAAVGDAVAQHADARHGDRLSGHGARRGHAAVRRARHDAAVRVGGAPGRAMPTRWPRG